MSPSNQYYFVNQKLRHPDWERIKTLPSNVLIQLKLGGMRIMLLSEANDEVWGLDEIQYTRNLDLKLQIAQVQQFSPISLLSEAEIKKVILFFDSEIFGLVPQEYFSPLQTTELLEMLAELPENSEVLAMSQPGHDFTVIHALPLEWKSWASQLFESSEAEWLSTISGLVHQTAHCSLEENERFVVAQIEASHIVLIGAENGKILFVNRYQYRAENDLLYFILLVMNELELKPESAKIILTGNILSGSLGFEKLARYFGRLEFARNETDIYIPFGFEELHQHNYFDLLSLPSLLRKI